MGTQTRTWSEQVAHDPDILGGKPVIKGTRVPIELVVGSLAGGMSAEDVCGEYRLTPQQVQAALAYAADVPS